MTHLNGFHLAERYIVGKSSTAQPDSNRRLVLIFCLLSLAQIVLYHHPTRQQQAVAKATELKEREEALAEEKKRLGITD